MANSFVSCFFDSRCRTIITCCCHFHQGRRLQPASQLTSLSTVPYKNDWTVNTSLCNKCQIHTKFFCLQTVDPIVNGLVSSASDNPKRLWQSTNSYTTNPPHCYPPLLLALHLQTALLLFFTSKISKLCLSLASNPATSSPHSPSHPVTPPHFSVFTPASESESTRSCPTVQTSNLIQIPSPPGFSMNVHSYLFQQSPILSTSP